jgi:hypothetical protein
MDCSGTIDYVLTQHGMKDVPRSSDEMCEWVRKRSGLHLAPDGVELTHDAFSALRPGDLLFWTGTYETLPRKLPVSHIMMYLGTLKKTGKPVVFGSSDGRYYDGRRCSGVSVFDFSMPRAGSKAAFFGYGSIPGMIRAKAQEEVRKALPSPGKELVMIDSSDKKAAIQAPEKQPLVVAAREDPPAPAAKEQPKAETKPPTVAKKDDDDDEPKKAPPPRKTSPSPHKKKSTATAKKKASADDDTPGAVVRKAVDAVRKAFE